MALFWKTHLGHSGVAMKQSEKYAFNMFDLSLSVIASLPSNERVGIVDLPALMYFIVLQQLFLV